MLKAVGVALLLGGATLAADALWIPAKAVLAQWLLERAWARSDVAQVGIDVGAARVGTRGDGERAVVRPWPWADAWPVARLGLGDDDYVVLAGTEGSAMPFAPTWLMSTVPPGQAGTTVIAAHRDTHFRGLTEIAVGEALSLALPGGERFNYRVTALEVHDAAGDAALRLRDDGVRRLALITCYPLDGLVPGGTLRYVVWAEAG